MSEEKKHVTDMARAATSNQNASKTTSIDQDRMTGELVEVDE